MARVWAGACLTAVLLLLVLVSGAPPAAAHAGLVSSDPVMGQLLDEAPRLVTLTFAEPVSLSGEARLFDDTGRELEVSAEEAGRRLLVGLPDLGDGTHVLAWTVTSADGHPVAGSLEFSVGFVSPVVAGVADGEAADGASVLTGVLHAATYAGGLLLAGVVLVHGVGPVAPLLRRTVVGSGAVAVVAGAFTLSLLAIALLSAGCVLACLRWRPVAVVGAVVALGAFLVEGHSRTSLLVAAGDVGHLLAGAGWLGGLVGCAVALRRLTPADAGRVLARFSLLAGGATAVVAVTGTLMGAQLLGSWSALTGTTYGRLLMVKAGVVLVVVAIAALNRFRLLPSLRRRPTAAAARVLRRAVGVEAAVMVLALGVTGFLVQSSSSSAAADTGASRSPDGVAVRVTVSPGVVGPNTVRIEVVGPDGPVELAAPPRVVLFGEELELGQGPAVASGPGAFSASQVIPVAGRWEARLAVDVTATDTKIVSVPFEVAAGG